ncbi:MAG: diaminopimelate decarboxylase [Patescibacteria group bacterium]
MAVKNKTSWISESFATEKHQGKESFFISGVSLEEIVAKVPPPFYVYDAATIKRQYEGLRDALAPYGISIYYAVKPNTALAIVDGLYKLGAGLDVASLGELLVAQKIGADPKKVSFAGPVKTDEALAFAISYGIDVINVEGEEEIERINTIAKAKGVRQRIALRINIEQPTEHAAHQIMAGGVSKFGIDEAIVTKDFIQRVQQLPHSELVGMHVYAANMLNTETFLTNVTNICRVAQKLNKYFPIRSIDFGGGLGIPYAESEQPLQLATISKKLGDVLAAFPFLQENKVALSVEPGRYIVGQSGIYIARVDSVKESYGKKIVLVDGGVHHLLRPSLVDTASTHPAYNLSRLDSEEGETMDIGGSLCSPIDFLRKDVSLPKDTKRGDLIGVFVAGAYGWSEAMPYFMSMHTASEVLVNNGKFFVIRKSEHPKTFLKKQILPKENQF